MKIVDGTKITIKGIKWDAGWEFGSPSVIFSPVFRYGEDIRLDNLAEDLCIQGCIDGKFTAGNPENEIGWRGWTLKSIKRRFYNNSRHIIRLVWNVRFYSDKNDQLQFEIESEEK